jgi:hypothetical protein
MAVTAATSVLSFSAVLTQTFAAVGMSTLLPAAFVESVRIAKSIAAAGEQNADALVESTLGPVTSLLPDNAREAAANALRSLARSASEPSELNVLLPKTATIDAEFEFHGAESYSAEMGAGAMVQLVSVNAGYSALYTVSSSNRVRLHIEFQTVNVTIAP